MEDWGFKRVAYVLSKVIVGATVEFRINVLDTCFFPELDANRLLSMYEFIF